ncbi:MAG TPA: ABC transporter permease subunit [Streptosporangiaceae bacterium]
MFNGTVASITLRAALGRRRALLLAIPPVILVVVTILLKAARPEGAPWPGRILGDFGFSVVLPLTALVIGTSVLGAEIDDGSIIHLLATPVRRSAIIFTKFVIGALLTMLFVAVPELIAGLIATSGDHLRAGQLVSTVGGGRLIAVGGNGNLALGLFIGALVGSVLYNALFVMISVVTTRAIAVGLLYVLIWEGLLGNFVSGARELSLGQYSLGVANAIAHDHALNAALSLTTALVMGVIVTVAALIVASRRLSSFSVKGDAV